MESVDSSPNYMRATSSFDARKDDSPGGSECDDIISVSSSTCGSSIHGPIAPKLNNNVINYRTSNKKTLKNFGNVRSFRRRAKSRVIQSPVPISDEESFIDSSHSSPHYLKGTSSSEGKKTHSQMTPRHSESPFDRSDKNISHSSQQKSASPSHKFFQTVSRSSSLRSVRILIKKTSFKPKRSSLNYSKVSEDVSLDRATYSSTIKDSKFPQPVELHSGGIESEKSSAVRVCRYHHCSLHGHRHGSHDPVPRPKRFLYKRRRSSKKQESVIPKSESSPGGKHSSDKKRNLQKSKIVPIVEPSNQESISDSMTFSGDENKNGVDSLEENFCNQEAQPFGDGYIDIQQSYLVEVAFGETAFPERSYQENLNILRKYSSQGQDFGRASFGRSGYCSRCSRHNIEEVPSTPGRAETDLSIHKVSSSSLDGYKNDIPQNGSADVLGASSPALFKKPKEKLGTYTEDSSTLSCANESSNKDCPETPVVFDDVSENNSASPSASYSQTASESNSEEEIQFTTESTTAGDSKVNEVAQVDDSETNSPVQKVGKLQFSKPRHISMWHLIQQHMSSNLVAEPRSRALHGADGESPVDGANSLPAKESTTSSKDLPESDMSGINNDSETQEIEIRKLYAIKLVREAIEKILLAEVQDQTSDDQSVTSESTPRPELVENNQSKVSTHENYAESDAVRGGANSSSNPKEEGVIADDASSREIRETEKKTVRKSENKAPKHWSNLKKWILLQRFIRELEKVRKFNPRKPRHLPLNPDPETEKVNLRPQTVDGRKSAEEWMLDYALRQAVSQLAPTQKRKVSLLVKAFETVVPPQEDTDVQFRIPRLRDTGLDVGITGYNVDESVTNDHNVPILGSADQETGIKTTKETERVSDVKDNGGESSVMFQSSNGERIGELTSKEKSVIISRGCTSMDDLPESEEENPRETAGDAVSGCIDGNSKDSGQPNQMDRKNHIKMWHMIYQHVASGIAEKVGSQLFDGAEDDEVEEDGDSNDFSQPIDDSSKDNHVSNNLRGGLTKSDALKLVKEAVDEILLPEIQDDSSDTRSVTSESVPDQDISERNYNEIGGEGGNLMSEEQKSSTHDIIRSDEDLKAESQVSNKPVPPTPKNWSKLKKLILLKRSIRALEKSRKLKPQQRQLFPQTPDPEPEKVDLRRQMMDERKKAEQWMLDYAVQHIVTKLTPARKRRVSMLVEAFEAVVPLPEI